MNKPRAPRAGCKEVEIRSDKPETQGKSGGKFNLPSFEGVFQSGFFYRLVSQYIKMIQSTIVGYCFQPASDSDKPAIAELLSANDLPYEDIECHLRNFITLKRNGKIIGVVGIEVINNFGLLRSLAVAEPDRNKRFGLCLVEKIIKFARDSNVNQLYLLTITAEQFFKNIGFYIINRNEVPNAIQNTKEFTSLCPLTARCMMKEINGQIQYYKKDELKLEEDIPGAKMWGVALDNTMLTYFEVEPNSTFESHKHESEQITMVLEGELYFESNDKVFCVKSGEVIAIPSNVQHSVFTKENAVKAIDAWSPVMGKYKRENG